MAIKRFAVFMGLYLFVAGTVFCGMVFGCGIPVYKLEMPMVGLSLGYIGVYMLHRLFMRARAVPVTRVQSPAASAEFPPECVEFLGMTKAQLDAEIKALEPVMDRGAATYKTYANLLQRLGTTPAEDFILTIDDGLYVKACYRDMHLRHVRNVLFRQPRLQTKATLGWHP